MSKTWIMYNPEMEEMAENDDFVGDKEDDEVDIDDEFEDIEEEEDYLETNDSSYNDTGV